MTVQLIDARAYRVRHIHPTATRSSEGGTAPVLGQTYGFTELPLEHSPTSAGLVEGSYTTRLGDSGEFSLTFPNAAGAKGLWRDLFSTDLSLEVLEIYRDDVLEFVGSIQRVEIDRGVVTVSGPDAWNLLRRAYERDQSWTAAPRDVIEHYTQVPTPKLIDTFPDSSLAGNWTVPANNTATVANGEVTIKTTNAGTMPFAWITDTLTTFGDYWTVKATGKRVSGSVLYLEVGDGTDTLGISAFGGSTGATFDQVLGGV